MRTARLRVVSGGGVTKSQGGRGGVTKPQVGGGGGGCGWPLVLPTSPPPRWTEWVTHACKNITFARFATRGGN